MKCSDSFDLYRVLTTENYKSEAKANHLVEAVVKAHQKLNASSLRREKYNLIKEIKDVYSNYNYQTEILAASIRNTMHIINCAKIGADVMTGPLSAIISLAKHPLTDSGLKKFLADY